VEKVALPLAFVAAAFVDVAVVKTFVVAVAVATTTGWLANAAHSFGHNEATLCQKTKQARRLQSYKA